MQGSRYSIGSKTLACAAATLIAVVLGEMLVRCVLPAPNAKAIELGSSSCVYRRSSNPVLGFELKADYRSEDPDFIESYERTNSHGQRDDERTIEKPSGVSRVLLLGDSVVEGYGLQQRDTISQQLQSLYNLEQQTEVLNFGVSAYCTLAEIELLAAKGIQFAPDHVVLVFVENDFDNFNREAFPLGQTIERPSWAKFLFRRSYLFRLTCLQFDLFQFRAQADPVAWNHKAIGDNNVAVGLKRFRQLADEHSFQPLIAVWPRFLNDRVTDVHAIPDSDLLIVEALAARNRIPSFRLSKYFESALAANSTGGERPISPKLLFSQGDELHPSSEGAKIAAQAIHEALTNGVAELSTHDPIDNMRLDKAIAQVGLNSPNYARVFNRIGNDYLKKGQFDEAIEQYEKALIEDADNAASHNNIGIALQRAGKEGAIEHYRQAVALQRDFAEAHFNLGAALERSDRAEAEQEFVKAVRLKPDFVQAHFGLSRSLLRDGRRKAAVAGFRQVLQLDPQHEKALLALANELARQNRFPESRELFEQLIVLQPNHAEALNNLGAICAADGDDDTAIEYFRAAVKADPDHPRASKNLHNLLNSSRTTH